MSSRVVFQFYKISGDQNKKRRITKVVWVTAFTLPDFKIAAAEVVVDARVLVTDGDNDEDDGDGGDGSVCGGLFELVVEAEGVAVFVLVGDVDWVGGEDGVEVVGVDVDPDGVEVRVDVDVVVEVNGSRSSSVWVDVQ